MIRYLLGLLWWEGAEPVEVTWSRDGSIALSSFTETRPGVRGRKNYDFVSILLFPKINTVVKKKMHYF